MSVLNKILYTTHLAVMPLFILLAWALPFWAYVGAIALYLVHVYVFKGCVITKIQRKFNGIAKDLTFTQDMVKKFWKKNMSLKAAALSNIAFFLMISVMNIVRNLYGIPMMVDMDYINQVSQAIPSQLESVVAEFPLALN